MGFINLLKNGYRGKLGETVGQQWKNQMTVRTYNPTNNSKSEAQLKQRDIYKKNISQASLAYSALVGVNKSAAKGMNLFNIFTSQWSKTKGSMDDSWIKSGIFDRPNIKATHLGIFEGRDGIYIVFDIPQELDLKKARRFVVKGFFCARIPPAAVASPIITTIQTIGVGTFDSDTYGQVTPNGLIMKIKNRKTNPDRTIFQLTFELNGKHYATNLIGNYLAAPLKIYQYSAVNYFWKSPYFS